jgi:transcriptional regulator with XRE-family HTH domain
MPAPHNPFSSWLNATMRARGLSQAELARIVGVADAQVSRWRRGHVVPTVRYLQRIAESLDVPRARLDVLAGYPVDEAADAANAADPERDAELEAHEATIRRLLEERLPQQLWPAYVRACEALAASLAAGFEDALDEAASSAGPKPASPPRRHVGFQP